MRTARIMVTTKCDRGCSYCCNTPKNPAIQSCSTMRGLSYIPDVYDAYVITGGEPLNDWGTVEQTRCAIESLSRRGRPVYLYTATWPHHTTLPIHRLAGVTYTIHHPFTPKDRLALKAIEKEIAKYGTRLHNRLTVNKSVPRHKLPRVRLKVWNSVEHVEFDPDGMCPLPEGEDLYLLEGE